MHKTVHKTVNYGNLKSLPNGIYDSIKSLMGTIQEFRHIKTRIYPYTVYEVPSSHFRHTTISSPARSRSGSRILSNLTRVTMAIYERPVRDEYRTDSIDCWL
jgi:hypothetical protein